MNQQERIFAFKLALAEHEGYVRYRDKSRKTGMVSLKVGFYNNINVTSAIIALTPLADKHVLTPAGARFGPSHRFHFYADHKIQAMAALVQEEIKQHIEQETINNKRTVRLDD